MTLTFYKVILYLLFLPVVFSCRSTDRDINKPNIILIMADDMGYECLGCNGSTEYLTPNLDKLANTGI
ncbi:MAG: sulfatase-like hydrolase/transferase, partial [Prolixibacteraceae bacterium]|nr:sulfatase-like hydrolase/transferase [Prolixibacteraceae bacterium]